MASFVKILNVKASDLIIQKVKNSIVEGVKEYGCTVRLLPVLRVAKWNDVKKMYLYLKISCCFLNRIKQYYNNYKVGSFIIIIVQLLKLNFIFTIIIIINYDCSEMMMLFFYYYLLLLLNEIPRV